jgi:hypothetical protein
LNLELINNWNEYLGIHCNHILSVLDSGSNALLKEDQYSQSIHSKYLSAPDSASKTLLTEDQLYSQAIRFSDLLVLDSSSDTV